MRMPKAWARKAKDDHLWKFPKRSRVSRPSIPYLKCTEVWQMSMLQWGGHRKMNHKLRRIDEQQDYGTILHNRGANLQELFLINGNVSNTMPIATA